MNNCGAVGGALGLGSSREFPVSSYQYSFRARLSAGYHRPHDGPNRLGPALREQALKPHGLGGILSPSPWAALHGYGHVAALPSLPVPVCKVGIIVVGTSWVAEKI